MLWILDTIMSAANELVYCVNCHRHFKTAITWLVVRDIVRNRSASEKVMAMSLEL